MTISPLFAAGGGAALVAVVVAFGLRPPQLTPHPAAGLSVARQAPGPHAAPPAARQQALVYVAGAVAHPGVYALAGDARALDALAKAGGATRDADLVAVNLAAHVADGDEIAVPRAGEAHAKSSGRAVHRRTASTGAHRARRRPRRDAPRYDAAAGGPEQTVDLNTADEDTLAELPGIGPTLAARIVEFRELNGPFTSVDGLADVAGITPQHLDELAPFLTAGHAAP